MICYAVGWTQHTTGVQTIRAATILQSLLAISAGPGAASSPSAATPRSRVRQISPTLYNLLPGYLNTPSALKNHDTLADYIETEISPTSYWYHFPKFIVSLLTAWFGAAATRENDYGFGWLLRNVGDHSHLPMFVAMSEGKIHGFMAMGQNPAVGGQNASFQRRALAKLDWLVVRDTRTRPRPPRSGLTAPKRRAARRSPRTSSGPGRSCGSCRPQQMSVRGASGRFRGRGHFSRA